MAAALGCDKHDAVGPCGQLLGQAIVAGDTGVDDDEVISLEAAQERLAQAFELEAAR